MEFRASFLRAAAREIYLFYVIRGEEGLVMKRKKFQPKKLSYKLLKISMV